MPTDEQRMARAFAAYKNARQQPAPVLTDRNGLVDPRIFTDDQLRAECNRRWGDDDCPIAKTLRHERDEARRESSVKQEVVWAMRRLAEHLGIADGTNESDADFVRRQVLSLVKERDEWKRKAEAVEGATVPALLDGSYVLPKGFAAWLPKPNDPKVVADLQAMIHGNAERGPGITALPTPRPDNSVAHLDVDLLCEDA